MAKNQRAKETANLENADRGVKLLLQFRNAERGYELALE
jgi:hypothetical protein